MLLGTCYLSGFQLVQLKRPNPIITLQFIMMVVCLTLIVFVALYNRENPWLSLAFFLVALTNLVVMIRQNRMLPPIKPFE